MHPQPDNECDDLEDYASEVMNLSTDVLGVSDTTMSAADQFCIKCQSGTYEDDPMCDCCDTDYTYDDEENIITYDDEEDSDTVVPDKKPVDKKLRETLQRRAGII